MPTERKPEAITQSRPASVRNGAGRFCVGNINPGNVRYEFMMSMVRLIQDDKVVGGGCEDCGHHVDDHGSAVGGCAECGCTKILPRVLITQTRAFEQFIVNAPAGPYLDAERNVVVNRFMQCDADVLVFIDSDISFQPADVYNLVALCTEDDPVVGGWYENDFPDHGRRPVAFDWSQPEDADRPKLQPIGSPVGTPYEMHPHPVDVIGTGFLAIHRTLLDTMTTIYDAPTPWFAELALWGQQMGEDVTFCMRVKSMNKKTGESFEIHDPTRDMGDDFFHILFAPIPVTHYKSTALIPNTTPPSAPPPIFNSAVTHLLGAS